jgi:hypothetical protein
MVGSRPATKGIDGKWLVFISVSAISPGEWTEGWSVRGRLVLCQGFQPRICRHRCPWTLVSGEILGIPQIEAGSEGLTSKEEPGKRQKTEDIGGNRVRGEKESSETCGNGGEGAVEPLGNEHVTDVKYQRVDIARRDHKASVT